MNLQTKLKNTPRSKLIVAGSIIFGGLFIILFSPHGTKYNAAVNEELQMAKKVCESSLSWVMENPERLKMDNSSLAHIKVDGGKVDFKYVKPPFVLFYHSGFVHPGAPNEIYCTFSDPRDSTADYYFNYEKRRWDDKMRFRH